MGSKADEPDGMAAPSQAEESDGIALTKFLQGHVRRAHYFAAKQALLSADELRPYIKTKGNNHYTLRKSGEKIALELLEKYRVDGGAAKAAAASPGNGGCAMDDAMLDIGSADGPAEHMNGIVDGGTAADAAAASGNGGDPVAVSRPVYPVAGNTDGLVELEYVMRFLRLDREGLYKVMDTFEEIIIQKDGKGREYIDKMDFMALRRKVWGPPAGQRTGSRAIKRFLQEEASLRGRLH